MCQNRRFIVHFTLTFDLKILESDFSSNVHLVGFTGRHMVHVETIRPVNEDAVLYPVFF